MSASSPQWEGRQGPWVWVLGLVVLIAVAVGFAFWGTSAFAQTVGVKTIVEGQGASPGPTDTVAVLYVGKLADGRVFDATQPGQPAQFPLAGVIPGFSQGIQRMKPGGRAIITIPWQLAYGEQGTPGGPIPPKADLTFEVQLVAVAPHSAQ